MSSRSLRNVILGVAGLIAVGTWPVQAEANKPQQVAVHLLQGILADTMVAKSYQGSTLIADGKDSFGSYIYAVVRQHQLKPRPRDECSIRILNGARFDVNLSLDNSDNIEVPKEPEWARLEPSWDAFVTRHWPIQALHRITKWQQAIESYQPTSGTFGIVYAIVQNDVLLFSVTLRIRLADGAIGGLSSLDNRPLLNDKPAPAAMTTEQLLSGVQRALDRSSHKQHLRNLRIVSRFRQVLMSDEINSRPPNHFLGFTYELELRGDTASGKSVGFNAKYIEYLQKAVVTEAFDPSARQNAHRPLTVVEDVSPTWSADGQRLYFITTRDVRGRPWWQRDSQVTSIACVDLAAQGRNKVVVTRPLKPLASDVQEYGFMQVSPSSRYIAATLSMSSPSLVLLDNRYGVLYLPDYDSATKSRLVKWFGSDNDKVHGLRLNVFGVSWLPGESGLMLGLQRDSDLNIYVARWSKDTQPQQMELTPVVSDRGDDVLPCIGGGANQLAWAHKLYKRDADNNESQSDQWQFLVADFDVADAKISNRHSVELLGEPLSITWDSADRRWLVVTDAAMLWVQVSDRGLQTHKINELQWGKVKLHPTGACVSPRADRIAVAATLSQPQTYEMTQAVVSSLIFLWDGKSQQVQPLYDPSLNSLARYVFPATGSPWAKISGNVKKFGLDKTADPAYFLPETPVSDKK